MLHVDPDAHGRNRTILESLLPTESSSKVGVGLYVCREGEGGALVILRKTEKQSFWSVL